MKTLLFLLLSLPLSVFAEGGLPNQPYIYVQGYAEIQKPADMAIVRFDLAIKAPDPGKVKEKLKVGSGKIFDVFKENKINDIDVIAEQLRTGPDYEQSESPSRVRGKIIGYFASREFQLKIRDLGALSKIVDQLLAIDGVELSAIEGGLSTREEVENQLCDKALLDARKQAEKTTNTMGMKVDSIYAVSPISVPDIKGDLLSSNAAERVIVTGSNVPTLEEGDYARFRIAPIVVSERVHVIYLVSPGK
jgi:uncharacterized protein YggE